MHQAFFVHFLAVVARPRHETSDFTRPLYGVDEHNTKFSFSFPKLRYDPFGFNAKKISPTFDKLNEVEWDRWILKRWEFTFLSDVFGLLSSKHFTTMATWRNDFLYGCLFTTASVLLPACRRLLFPLLHATKEIGDVCTQATVLCLGKSNNRQIKALKQQFSNHDLIYFIML